MSSKKIQLEQMLAAQALVNDNPVMARYAATYVMLDDEILRYTSRLTRLAVLKEKVEAAARESPENEIVFEQMYGELRDIQRS